MRKALKRILLIGMLIDIAIVAVLFVMKRRFPSQGDEQSDEIALSTIMNGQELKSLAKAFRGGSAMTAAGGTSIDLRGATLAPEGGTLKVRTWMGGTELLVPEAWQVEVRGRALMGGISDRTLGAESDGDVQADEDGAKAAEPAESPDGPRFVIDAMALMGGIDIGHRRHSELAEAKEAIEEHIKGSAPEVGGAEAGVPI